MICGVAERKNGPVASPDSQKKRVVGRSTLDFDLLRFISNPPADISGPRRAFMIATLAH